MGNVGDANNLVVNSGWILKQGTDQYILKNTLTLDISRPRFRDAIEIGPVNTFGAGDHSVPVEFEADITKGVNWVNLNTRDANGFLTNLPYTLEMKSKPFTGTGSGATGTVAITGGLLTTPAVTGAGSNYTSVLITITGITFTTAPKVIGIISEGSLIGLNIIDAGTGVSGTPVVVVTEVSSPLAFSFNAEVGDVSLAQSESEGRLKINATLIITDDAVLPVDA